MVKLIQRFYDIAKGDLVGDIVSQLTVNQTMAGNQADVIKILLYP